MCLSASRYFSSQFNGTQCSSWLVFQSVKCPPSQKFLSDCLQRSTVTPARVYLQAGVFIFCWSQNCRHVGKLKTRFSEIFFSSSPLCQLAPPLWLSAFHPIHTNAKISKWLKSYQCLNCNYAKSMNAVKKLNSGEKVLIFVNVQQFAGLDAKFFSK